MLVLAFSIKQKLLVYDQQDLLDLDHSNYTVLTVQCTAEKDRLY